MQHAKLVSYLDKFIFHQVRRQQIEFWRIIFYSLLLIYLWNTGISEYFRLSGIYWKPISYFKLMPFLQPPINYVTYFEVIWKFSLLFSAVGFFTCVSKWVAFIGALIFIGYPNNFYFVTADVTAVVFSLGFLALCPIGNVLSVDNLLFKNRICFDKLDLVCIWPIRILQLLIVTFWFSAGIQKLRISGLDWVLKDSLGHYLIFPGHPIGLWMVSMPGLTKVLSALTIVIELASPLVFIKNFKWPMLGHLFIFHLASSILLKVTFISWLFVFIFWIEGAAPKKYVSSV